MDDGNACGAIVDLTSRDRGYFRAGCSELNGKIPMNSERSKDFVVLYKKEPDDDDEDRWWLTSAALIFDRLRITSGGSRYEWSVTIAAREIAVLRKALLQRLPDTTDSEEQNAIFALLELFAKRFHDRDGDPYRAIVDVLNTEGIEYEKSDW